MYSVNRYFLKYFTSLLELRKILEEQIISVSYAKISQPSKNMTKLFYNREHC